MSDHESDQPKKVNSRNASENDIWPSWLRRYKDFIEAVAVVLGVLLGLFTMWVVYVELDNSVKQTQAIMYQNKPIMNIKPLQASKDIVPSKSKFYSPSGVYAADSSRYSAVSFTLKNQGHSAAFLDTIRYDLISDEDTVLRIAARRAGIIRVRDEELVETSPWTLQKDHRYLLRIFLVYYWEQRDISDERLELNRWYFIRFDGTTNQWSTHVAYQSSIDSALIDRTPYYLEWKPERMSP